MFMYASIIDEGKEIKRNLAEASRYYKLAADNGHVKSMKIYAIMTNTGEGFEKI